MKTPRSKVARDIRLKRDRLRVGGLGNPDLADLAVEYFKGLGASGLANEAQSIFRSTMGEMGVVCFSEHNDDVLMWSHYANCHKGICIRFKERWPMDLPLLFKVIYSNRRATFNFPSSGLVDRTDELFNVLCTKAKFWEYEQEWRLFWHKGASKVAPIAPSLIDQIILGAMISEETEQAVRDLVRRRKTPIGFSRAVIDPDTFSLKIEPQEV